MSSAAAASASLESAAGRRGLLFIVSAPSGTGKTTLVERLVQIVPNLRMSRSYTSRTARVGEQHGVDYNFVSRERFEAMIGESAFLEWAEENPGEVFAIQEADAEREIRRMVREQERAERERAVGEVPF